MAGGLKCEVEWHISISLVQRFHAILKKSKSPTQPRHPNLQLPAPLFPYRVETTSRFVSIGVCPNGTPNVGFGKKCSRFVRTLLVQSRPINDSAQVASLARKAARVGINCRNPNDRRDATGRLSRAQSFHVGQRIAGAARRWSGGPSTPVAIQTDAGTGAGGELHWAVARRHSVRHSGL
jgi:hypothetical protein